MIEWFKNLTDANKIAIVVPVAVAVIGGLIGLFKWLFRKKDTPAASEKTIQQSGKGHTATAIDGNKNIVAGVNVTTGIDSDATLNTLVKTSKELGRTEEENIRLKETIKQLEEQLARPSLETNIALVQSKPVPSAQARELAGLITEDDGLYARALKAISEGDNEKADSLLNQTQQFLDTVQQRKDEAQAKIYMARMQNASYAGRPQEALQYCDKLTTLAGNDSLVINNMATAYYENAKYKEAEPLMQRALKIDEASLGKDHPRVAIDLNNLATFYHDTNRLEEAEPLMERQLVIVLQFTRQTGHLHPHLEDALANYVALLMNMGHSKDQVDARLKRLAPEMFESTDKQIKEE